MARMLPFATYTVDGFVNSPMVIILSDRALSMKRLKGVIMDVRSIDIEQVEILSLFGLPFSELELEERFPNVPKVHFHIPVIRGGVYNEDLALLYICLNVNGGDTVERFNHVADNIRHRWSRLKPALNYITQVGLDYFN